MGFSSTTVRDIYNALGSEGPVTRAQILDGLTQAGIAPNDPRTLELHAALEKLAVTDAISLDHFREITASCFSLLERAVKESLAIPQFPQFADDIQEIARKVTHDESGDVARYIPQLAQVNPDQFAVAICTVDGQRLSIGDADQMFCFQSTCKPLLYCAALEEHGESAVHQHIGREPSGKSFNELTLNPDDLPHNPMINAGAIMTSSLLMPDRPMAERFDHVINLVTALSAGRKPGFNNALYHSERETADRNYALAHYMREVGAFGAGVDIERTLDLYFSACSIEISANAMAMMAATFANGGVCPQTGNAVFRDDTVKNCLSMMYSCGMYDYSGEFAFRVGLPAKSGVSGAVMIVIPNVMGIVVWSPRLDRHGNSVRGVEFMKQLVGRFNFHTYDSLVKSHKTDPRQRTRSLETHAVFSAIQAASNGDISELKRLLSFGLDLNLADYDGRTPLHLAACEGRLETVHFLLDKGVRIDPKDRWGNTPENDAIRHSQELVAVLLRQRSRAPNTTPANAANQPADETTRSAARKRG